MPPPTKITCPECDSVLKLPGAVPPGKKIKCPQCEAVFVPVVEKKKPEVPAKDRAKPAAGPAPGPGKPAKPAAGPAQSAPPKKAPAKKKADDDEQGSYGVVKDPVLDAEDEDERKPKINYVPDLSIKDKRGPAQEMVVKPSNALIANGVSGFLGWLGVLVIMMIPILFPLQPANPTEQGQPQQASARRDEEPKMFEFYGVDLGEFAGLPIWVFILIVIGVLFNVTYSALIVTGGVKMQSLESRAWSIAACVMCFIPFHTMGLFVLTGVLLQVVLGTVLGDAEVAAFYVMILGVGEWSSTFIIGVWALIVLMKPEVKEGFEYKAD
jgi:hypothetical protein